VKKTSQVRSDEDLKIREKVGAIFKDIEARSDESVKQLS
jgi:hypothetical protein